MASVDANDKYAAAIDVSNACRMFYVSRLQTAETLKDRLVDRRRAVRAAAASSPPRGPTRPAAGSVDDIATLESVLAQLHKELASLIDIDLQVMRQLLMLNDQVEEMKWQRRQQHQQRKSLLSSTCATPSIDDADGSDSEHKWSRCGGLTPGTPDSWSLLPLHRPSADHDDDEEEATLKYPSPSALSLLNADDAHDDRFSDSGSVDALDRPNPDTPDVFAVARSSPPKKPVGGTTGDAEVSKETNTSERRSSASDGDQKSSRSPTRTKEDTHSTGTDSFQDFCTYVEMLI